MTKTRFEEEKPYDVLGSRVQQNLEDLLDILKWNIENNIQFYRVSSNLVPLKTLYDISDLPNSQTVRDLGSEVGKFIRDKNLRISFHPDHFVKLASPTDSVVQNSVDEIEEHAYILNDLFQLDQSLKYPINVHIGAHYQDKDATRKRFIDVYKNQLSQKSRSYLTVENDDSSNLWSCSELIDIHNECGIPITFDYHHHSFSGKEAHNKALTRSLNTWPENIVPITHYSEPQTLHDENSDVKPQKHSRLVDRIPMDASREFDVMIEATGKEKAILELR